MDGAGRGIFHQHMWLRGHSCLPTQPQLQYSLEQSYFHFFHALKTSIIYLHFAYISDWKDIYFHKNGGTVHFFQSAKSEYWIVYRIGAQLTHKLKEFARATVEGGSEMAVCVAIIGKEVGLLQSGRISLG